MSAHPLPTPPANQSNKGPGEQDSSPKDPSHGVKGAKSPGNLGEQARQGNIKQNTTHPGFQQDR